MTRARILKPDFFRSRSLARCSLRSRLTFEGLWCEADDAGRGIADARLLKGTIWPLDDDIHPVDIEADLIELSDTGHIVIYLVDGETYYAIQKWEKHQAAAYRRGEPRHPAPPANTPPPDPRTLLHADACNDVQDACKEVLSLKGEDATEPPADAAEPVDNHGGSSSSSSSIDDVVTLYVAIVADFPRNKGRDSAWRRGVGRNCRKEHTATIRQHLADGLEPREVAELLAGVKELALADQLPPRTPPHPESCECEGTGIIYFTEDDREVAGPCRVAHLRKEPA